MLKSLFLILSYASLPLHLLFSRSVPPEAVANSKGEHLLFNSYVLVELPESSEAKSLAADGLFPSTLETCSSGFFCSLPMLQRGTLFFESILISLRSRATN